MPKKNQIEPADQRIARRIVQNAVTGCAEWMGGVSTQGGYPTVGMPDGSVVYVHIYIWTRENGPVPEGPADDGSYRFEVHHRCMNRRCCNVDHLRVVTHREHQRIHKVHRDTIKAARKPRRPPTPPTPPRPPAAAAAQIPVEPEIVEAVAAA